MKILSSAKIIGKINIYVVRQYNFFSLTEYTYSISKIMNYYFKVFTFLICFMKSKYLKKFSYFYFCSKIRLINSLIMIYVYFKNCCKCM